MVFSSNTFELPGQGAIPHKGRSVALKPLGAATGGSIMMFDETVPAGTKSTFYLHHDSDKVAYVLSGEVRFSRAKPRGVTARHSLPLRAVQGAWSARFTSTASVIRTRCSCHRDIASPGMLPEADLLPHLICAR
jgi:hypothetical protein